MFSANEDLGACIAVTGWASVGAAAVVAVAVREIGWRTSPEVSGDGSADEGAGFSSGGSGRSAADESDDDAEVTAGDAVNQALEATGFEGELPEHEGNATQIPVEVMRAIAMLNDAAMELGLGDLGIEVIEDDTDLAMLASSIVQLSKDQEFIAAMTEPAMDPMAEPMAAAPMTAPTGMPAGGMPDEEALMMERM